MVSSTIRALHWAKFVPSKIVSSLLFWPVVIVESSIPEKNQSLPNLIRFPLHLLLLKEPIMSAKKNPLEGIKYVVLNRQDRLAVNKKKIVAVLEKLLADEGVFRGKMEIVVVDDPTIHELNVRFLNHDYPTDVLSFVLEANWNKHYLEGNVIVSADTAIDRAEEFKLTPEEELLLYIIHGTLHLVGYDDHNPNEEPEMREREQFYLNFSKSVE